MSKEEKMASLLEEILLWTKYDYEEMRHKMIEELNTDDKKIAYQLTDGENSTTQIASVVSVSQQSISKWWKSWLDSGIVKQTEKYGGKRRKRLISLAEMGIPFPEIPEVTTDE